MQLMVKFNFIFIKVNITVVNNLSDLFNYKLELNFASFPIVETNYLNR